MNLDEQINGTPAEKRRIQVEQLRQFKDSEGYKFLSEFVQDKQAELVRVLIDGDDDIDLVQLRADFKAWYKLLGAVDVEIDSYDIWLQQTLNRMNGQNRDMLRGINYAK